ncbi:MAG: HD domain-containing protein [Chloroflexi bacterium]|nr:HD domain-containing protein [Chloroflexota bacterium]
MIVGDEEAEFDGLTTALAAAGCCTEVVRGVGAACAALRSENFLAVVADLPAPNVDAFAILRAARRRSPVARVVVVLPSIPLGMEPLLDALRREAFEVIRHPLDTELIGRCVLDAIEETRADLADWSGSDLGGARAEAAPLAVTEATRAEAWGRLFTLLAEPGLLREEALYAMIDAARQAAGAIGAWLQSPPIDRTGTNTPTACGVDAASAAVAATLARETSDTGRALSLVVGTDKASGVYEAVPLGAEGTRAGALVMLFAPGRSLASDDRPLLAALAAQLAARRFEPVREGAREHASEMVVRALTRSLSLFDPAVERHSRRVGALAIDLALAAGVTPATLELREIERAAVLHDLGVIGMSSARTRTTALRDVNEERDRSEWGYRIVSDIPYLQRVAGLIRSSGEHWDGSGYPRRLVAESIPFGARLILLADTWDQLTFGREPGRALPATVAAGEIRADRGMRFDPRVVDAFDRVVVRWSHAHPLDMTQRDAAA